MLKTSAFVQDLIRIFGWHAKEKTTFVEFPTNSCTHFETRVCELSLPTESIRGCGSLAQTTLAHRIVERLEPQENVYKMAIRTKDPAKKSRQDVSPLV